MSVKEFENYHEVDLLDFQKYILSIGFKYNDWYYVYNRYKIDLYDLSNSYSFFNGFEWSILLDLNDLTLLENEFKLELRSIKLKQLLG